MEATNSETNVTEEISSINLKIINPGSKTTIDKLEEENFLSWKFQVLITLRGYGLQKFIEEDEEVPSKNLANTDPTTNDVLNPAYENWVRQDSLITAWFLSSMSKSLVSELLDCKTAREVWRYLLSRFSSKNIAKAIELRAKLDMMKKGNLGLQDYFTKIKNLIDSLEAAGDKITHDNHVMYIMAGLGPEYDPTVSVITGSLEMPSLQRVYALLLSHDNRLQRRSVLSSDGTLPSINYAAHGQSRNTNQYQVNNDVSRRGRGYTSRFQRRNWNSNQKPNCQLCGRFGHTVVKCYYRFDKSYQGSNSSVSSYARGSSSSTENSQQNPQALIVHNDLNRDNHWFPDSGATNHVTHDLANLNTATEYQGSQQWQDTSPRQAD